MPKIKINEVNVTTSQAGTTTSGSPIAILGSAIKGPMNEPTIINTYAQFLNVFGASAPQDYPFGYYAGKECTFLGNPIIYTRIGSDSAVKAQAVSAKAAGSYNNGSSHTAIGAQDSVFTFKAKYPGTYANGVSITYDVAITDATDGDGTVTITVANGGSVVATKTLSYLNGSELGSLDPNLGEVAGIEVIQNTTTTSSKTYINCPYTVDGSTYTAIEDNTVSLANGTDGISSADDIVSGVIGACEQLQDSNIYTFQFICAPGISEIENTNSVKVWQILSDLCCGTNYDASQTFENNDARLVIVDPAVTTTSYENILTDLGVTSSQADANAQMAIMYPWFEGNIVGSSQVVDIPPSIAYLRNLCAIQSIGYPCEPVAGPVRGIVSNVKDVREYLGSVKSESVVNMGVNPISYHRSYGYFFDGNVVYNPNAVSKTYKQLSIRNTINYIKNRLNEICFSLSYALNIPVIRTQFQGQVTSLLDTMKGSSYIYGYSVEISDSEDDLAEGRISATIKVFPTTALEEFVINLEVVNSGELL